MIIQFIIIAILTLLNAFFASAEMAMVSINKNKIMVRADEGDTKAVLLMKLLDEPSRFLATIQVGITLAGFFSSAFAATGLSDDLGQLLQKLGTPYSDQVALVLITIALSFVMLLFGELFPKRLALQKAESIAMFSVKPIYYISVAARPFVKILSASTNGLIKLVGIDQTDLEEKVSEEEIRSMVKMGQEMGVVKHREKQMITSVFEFDDKLAKEVMTPRMDVLMVDISKSVAEVVRELCQLTYSRIPVYASDKDEVVGVIHTKSLLMEMIDHRPDEIDLEKIMQPAFFVPETIVIDKLFVKLQQERMHMALLVDEYGLMTGIVTMEDLIEEVMGSIEDEFDPFEESVKVLESGVYCISGSMPIFEFNEIFHTDMVCDDADTVGGYMIMTLGELPDETIDSVVNVGEWVLSALNIGKKRILRIRVTKSPASTKK